MPYVNNNGVRIYYEVEGQGARLVLGHGLSGTLNHWRRLGYVDALRHDFRLILFDARGHGQSDKPHEPSAYGVKMASDVLAVLDDVGIGNAHYFGYSMGTMIGYRVAVSYGSRFRSFILGGASPYRNEAEIKARPISLHYGEAEGEDRILQGNTEVTVSGFRHAT
jgi:pimeloyl-ACP methyl ester carboxylesterase